MDCNATRKFGSRVAICDLPHGHDGDHRATLFPSTDVVDWADDWHDNIADAVVNPN